MNDHTDDTLKKSLQIVLCIIVVVAVVVELSFRWPEY